MRDETHGVTVINGVISDVTARWEVQSEAERSRSALEALVDERTRDLEQTVERLRASETRLRHAQALAHVGKLRVVRGNEVRRLDVHAEMVRGEDGSYAGTCTARSATSVRPQRTASSG